MTDPIGPPPDDDEDSRAFRRAVVDVRPLPQKRPAAASRVRPRPQARFTRAEREDVLRESLVVPGDPADLDTGEHMSFRRPGVREDVLRKLRRGQFAVEAEIDLHGLTTAEARPLVAHFLNHCRRAGLRCVRVIHGKGLRSRNRR